MTSLLNVMLHKDVEQLLTHELLDDLPDAERAFSREKTAAIIHAALWACSARSGSTASAYAINSLFEAMGLETWTFKKRPTLETRVLRCPVHDTSPSYGCAECARIHLDGQSTANRGIDQ